MNDHIAAEVDRLAGSRVLVLVDVDVGVDASPARLCPNPANGWAAILENSSAMRRCDDIMSSNGSLPPPKGHPKDANGG